MSYTKKLPAANTLTVLSALESLKVQDLHDYEWAKANIKNYIVSAERKGLEKYGHTMDRDDMTRAEWMQHLIEELCDGAQYANRAGLGAVMKDLLKIAVIVENMKS